MRFKKLQSSVRRLNKYSRIPNAAIKINCLVDRQW